MKTNIFKEKLFWVILISLVVGVISHELFRDSLSSFNNFLGLLQSIASFLTIGLAYLLFDKYGLRKNVVEKQFDAVIDVIQSLKKIRILYSLDIYDPKTGLKLSSEFGQITIQRDMSVYKRTDPYNKKNITFLVNMNDFFAGTDDLIKSLNNIWTPVEIKNNFKFLNVGVFRRSTALTKMTTIDIAFKGGILKAIPPLDFNTLNDGEIKFGQLIDSLEAGLIECENWIQKHSEHDFELNI